MTWTEFILAGLLGGLFLHHLRLMKAFVDLKWRVSKLEKRRPTGVRLEIGDRAVEYASVEEMRREQESREE